MTESEKYMTEALAEAEKALACGRPRACAICATSEASCPQ